jgi:hypothetical protein
MIKMWWYTIPINLINIIPDLIFFYLLFKWEKQYFQMSKPVGHGLSQGKQMDQETSIIYEYRIFSLFILWGWQLDISSGVMMYVGHF